VGRAATKYAEQLAKADQEEAPLRVFDGARDAELNTQNWLGGSPLPGSSPQK
jgi:hypothetical protein